MLKESQTRGGGQETKTLHVEISPLLELPTPCTIDQTRTHRSSPSREYRTTKSFRSVIHQVLLQSAEAPGAIPAFAEPRKYPCRTTSNRNEQICGSSTVHSHSESQPLGAHDAGEMTTRCSQ